MNSRACASAERVALLTHTLHASLSDSEASEATRAEDIRAGPRVRMGTLHETAAIRDALAASSARLRSARRAKPASNLQPTQGAGMLTEWQGLASTGDIDNVSLTPLKAPMWYNAPTQQKRRGAADGALKWRARQRFIHPLLPLRRTTPPPAPIPSSSKCAQPC
jgi:hypothetical protein